MSTEPQEDDRETPEEAAQELICADLTACYAQHNAYGQISGRVVVTLAEDGSVTDVTYQNGHAPDAVQQCLVETARGRAVPGWAAGPARITCEYSGTYMRGAQMMMFDSNLVRVPPEAEPSMPPSGGALPVR